jgi:hypothetical protein
MSCDGCEGCYSACENNCVKETRPSELLARCPCCFTIAVMIRVLCGIVAFALLCTICAHSNTNDYGENILRPIFIYSIGSLVAYIVWLLFSIYQSILFLKPAAYFGAMLFQIISFAFILRVTMLTNSKYVDDAKDFAFANWRVDNQFLRFQSNNGCDGINASKDSCEMCCDEDYTIAITNKIKSLNTYGMCITIFIGLTLFIGTVPEFCFQLICE